MKDFNEFFETDKDNNFFLKKDINLDDDSKQKLLANILEIQKNMAEEYVENKTNDISNNSNKDKLA